MTYCRSCGKELPDNANYCSRCAAPQWYMPTYRQPERYAMVGAILCVVGGVLGLISGGTRLMIFSSIPSSYYDWFDVLCTLTLIPSIFAIVAGYLAMKKRSWNLAFGLSMIGIFSYGFIFCLLGCIFIAISREEFAEEYGGSVPPPAPMGRSGATVEMSFRNCPRCKSLVEVPRDPAHYPFRVRCLKCGARGTLTSPPK